MTDGAKDIKLKHLYSMLKTKRDLVFEVLPDDRQQFDTQALKLN